jgi:hypothetical protein
MPPTSNPLEKLTAEWAIAIAAFVGLMATLGRILQRRPSVPYLVAIGMCLSSMAASVTATFAAFEWGEQHGRAFVVVAGIVGGVMGMGLFELLSKLFIAFAGQKITINLEDNNLKDNNLKDKPKGE